jgi:hypothetical protein
MPPQPDKTKVEAASPPLTSPNQEPTAFSPKDTISASDPKRHNTVSTFTPDQTSPRWRMAKL